MAQPPQAEKPSFTYVLRNDPEEVKQKYTIENSELLDDIEKMTGLDIIAEFQKNYTDLDNFMKREYMVFNSKIDNCLLKFCYNDIYKPRDELRECVVSCTQGIRKADKVVRDKFDLFTSSFATCIEAAQRSKQSPMQETFECYDTMLNTFESLKREVRNEFKYYE